MRAFLLAVVFMLVAFPALAVERYEATGSGAVAESITFGTKNVVVRAVVFGLDAACNTSENLVLRNGVNEDAPFYVSDFDTETSYVWFPDHLPILSKDDADESLDILFTNTDANDWTLQVYYEVVGY